VLRPGGLLVTAVQRRDRELAARVEAAGRRFAGISVEPDHVGLEALARLADQGRLKVHVSHAFALERVAEAHRLLETGRTLGKIVLTP
jgi:NADPH:quinone reductase-like Zn-dependent oxidoreductase